MYIEYSLLFFHYFFMIFSLINALSLIIFKTLFTEILRVLPEHTFAYKRLFATMAKAKNHKLNNFLMFLLEGKSVNPANPQTQKKVTKMAT